MPIPTEPQPTATNGLQARGHQSRTTLLVWLMLWLTGCGEPSVRELKNRRELEALLTAISLKNQKELDKDIQQIKSAMPRASSPTKATRTSARSARRLREGTGAEPRNRRMRCASRSPFFSERKGARVTVKHPIAEARGLED